MAVKKAEMIEMERYYENNNKAYYNQRCGMWGRCSQKEDRGFQTWGLTIKVRSNTAHSVGKMKSLILNMVLIISRITCIMLSCFSCTVAYIKTQMLIWSYKKSEKCSQRRYEGWNGRLDVTQTATRHQAPWFKVHCSFHCQGIKTVRLKPGLKTQERLWPGKMNTLSKA